MSSAEVLTELQPIFADILDLTDIELKRETTAPEVEGWDSLAHINLIVTIEKRFRVKFALGELQDLKNVGDMVDLIVRKLQP